jgi:DNA-directed RNA polymerase subunit H (RpoH/RPB5)
MDHPDATPVQIMRGNDNEIFRSFTTISEMLRDRGEDSTSLNSLAPMDVIALAGGRTKFHVDVPSCGLRVIYNLDQRFKLASIRKLLDTDEVRVFIVVTKEKPLHSVLKSLDSLSKDIQLFELRELRFNVSRHVLVPPHTPERDESVITDIMRRHSLKSRYHLPIILSTDPMARYLALKPGQLVRIQRPSPSAGTYTLYRCCIAMTGSSPS